MNKNMKRQKYIFHTNWTNLYDILLYKYHFFIIKYIRSTRVTHTLHALAHIKCVFVFYHFQFEEIRQQNDIFIFVSIYKKAYEMARNTMRKCDKYIHFLLAFFMLSKYTIARAATHKKCTKN